MSDLETKGIISELVSIETPAPHYSSRSLHFPNQLPHIFLTQLRKLLLRLLTEYSVLVMELSLAIMLMFTQTSLLMFGLLFILILLHIYIYIYIYIYCLFLTV